MNAYLVRVDPNGNKNAECRMIQETPERFRVEYGRIGAALLPRRYSNASWDTVYRAHIEKGYKDVTNLYNAGNQEITDFGSASVSALVQEMMNWANAEIEKNYAAGANFGITQNAVDRSQEILNRMSLTNSIPEFNDSLRELFTVIPRKMSDVSAFLVSSPDEFETVIEREQDLLDIAATRIVSGGKEKETVPNPLRTHHIEIQECTEKEKEMVKGHLDPETRALFRNAFHVNHGETRKAFSEYCRDHGIGDDGIRYYYHGSRNENYWPILLSGLRLRPTAHVVRSGSMFGKGLYFAPKAKKSLGYTSLENSHWAKGSSRKALLFVFKVAMGKQCDLDGYNSAVAKWDEKKCRKAGYDSVFAHKSAHPSLSQGRLYNDEAIVYSEKACTLAYIVEVAL